MPLNLCDDSGLERFNPVILFEKKCYSFREAKKRRKIPCKV
jgi:hypothetical protein